VTSSLNNLTGPGKPLAVEPPDGAEFGGLVKSAIARLNDAGEYEGDLGIDLRLVSDLVTATQAVAAAVRQLAPIER
jgi:hypothetical protein